MEDNLAEKTGGFRIYYEVAIGVIVLAVLYVISRQNYLLFHGIAEVFSSIVAFMIFILAWHTRRLMDNDYLLFLGIAFLFIGVFDLIHMLAYSGMGVFEGYGTDLPTQLWIATRYMEALSLLIAPLFLTRRLWIRMNFAVYSAVSALVLLSIFYWDIFPTCFVEGVGLTPFKKVSEYVISFILLLAIMVLFRTRQRFDPKVFKLMVASIAVTIASELSFTLYVDPYGFFNLMGHYLKIISFYLIYRAIIETGLERPYDILFRDLKLREEELEEKEKRERAILDASLDSISLVEPDGTILACNETTASRLGRDVEDLIGFNILDFFPPEVAASRRAILDKGFREGKTLRFEDERQGIYFDNIVYPVFGKKDHVEMLAVFARDITKRKKAEAELLESKELWERSFNAVKEGLFIMDNDHNILQCNTAFAKIVGEDHQNLVGLKCYEVIHNTNDPPGDCVTCAALESYQEAKSEAYEPSLDKYLEMSASPIPGVGGEPSLVIHLVRDITERKRAEERLERYAFELQGRVKELNCLYGISRIVERAGISLEDILLGVADILPPSWQYPEITCARITLRDSVYQTEDFQETPWRLARDIIVYGVKAGVMEVCYLEERPEADTGPFLAEENDLLRAVAERLGRIVERKESEAELKRYREQLEELVEERTRELQEINVLLQEEVAERKGKEKELKTAAGQLRALTTRMETILEEERRRIALEVHDKLGQELTGLKMNLSLLERRTAGEAEYMERVREISEMTDEIIQSVQEISMELRPSILDDLGLDAALEWQLESFGETTDIETRFASSVDSNLIDPDLGTALFRIFQEALTNIARHAGAGRVEVELTGEDGELLLLISDDGRGIEEREKTGIGSLGILGMKERAKAFGGKVDIIRGESGGTMVKVRIPFAVSGESEISREEFEE